MPRLTKPTYGPDQQFDLGEDDAGPKRDIVVNLDDRRSKKAPAWELIDGEAQELEDDQDAAGIGEGELETGEHTRNLALDYAEDFLDELGTELVEQIEADITERQPWRDRFEKGLEMMGLVESDIDDGPFPGCSNVVHPLLIEARTQFWARAMGELFPPDGPAKAKVLGEQKPDLVKRAARVVEYMNFDMTVQDEGYVEESSALIWDLPFYGSCFRKTFNDPVLNQTIGIYVPSDDLIVPAEARSLKTTPRFAHRMRKWPNEVRQLMVAGHFRQIELDLPSSEQDTNENTEQLKNETQDVAPDDDSDTVRHELFEVCITKSLPGDEHCITDEETGERNYTGLERSYYITVDRHTAKVLSIYRGWKQTDLMCRRRLYFEHWKYAPGEGFYGSGLFHLIGGLQVAATGTLRVLLDSAASASLSGGFVSKHANLKGKSLTLTPGHWEAVDATADDLQKAFYSPPVKEPSPALFNLLGFLTERGEKFTATTELMSGSGDPKNAPVGTTNMMLEQGGKVMTAIHRMAHGSLGRELRQRYELMREFVPAAGYPYDPGDDQQRTVYADDFAAGVSIVPVSDPNIFSSAQRIAQNQALYQIATETGILPMQKVVRRMLEGMRIPDIDDLMPPEVQPQAYDPVGEIQALFMGKPVMVIPEQPHVMHLKVLGAFAQNPQYAGNEQVQKTIGPNLLSILGQHMAYAWATHARGLGVPVGYMNPQDGQVMGGGSPEQIAAMLAQVAPALATVPGLPAIDEDGKDGKDDMELKRAEIQIEREKHDAQMQMEREKHQLELQKMQSKLAAEMKMNEQKVQIAAQKAQTDAKVAEMQANQKMQQTQMEGQMNAQASQQKMQIDQQSMERQAHMDKQKMATEQSMGQQKMANEQQMGQQKIAIKGQEARAKQAQAAPRPTDNMQTQRTPHNPQQAHPRAGRIRREPV